MLYYQEFETKRKKYIMDSNTGYVIATDDIILNIVKKIDKPREIIYQEFDNNISIEDFNKKYNFINACLNNGMFKNMDANQNFNIEDYIYSSNAANLILVVTEKCNLRCEYCVYSDKYPKEVNFSEDVMSFEVAKNAIDLLNELYIQRVKKGMVKRPCITFYGGEPLLNFNLIKEATKYAKEIIPEAMFYITTNGTILTNEMIEFLVNENFFITFSLDGNKENHNRNRKTISGQPTFEIIMSNIKKLQNYKLEKQKEIVISFNCCFDKYTDMEKAVAFFEQNYSLFSPFYILFSLVSIFDTTYYSWCKEQYKNNSTFVEDNNINSINKLYEKFVKNNYNDETYSILNAIFFSYFMFLIRDKGVKHSPLNNCCIPTSKIAISPDGTISLCEKMCKRHALGNCKNGLDLNIIQDVANKFIHALKKCENCPIKRLCNVCFMQMDENGEISEEFCNNEIYSKIDLLKKIYGQLEQGIDLYNLFRIDEKYMELVELNS